MPELLCQLGTYMLVFELIVAEILGRRERKSNLEGYGKFHLWHLGRKKFGIKHAWGALYSTGWRAGGAEEYDLLSILSPLRWALFWRCPFPGWAGRWVGCWFCGAVWKQESPEPHFSPPRKGPRPLRFWIGDIASEFLCGVWAAPSLVTSSFGWAGDNVEIPLSWQGWAVTKLSVAVSSWPKCSIDVINTAWGWATTSLKPFAGSLESAHVVFLSVCPSPIQGWWND